jgi:site-specific recombinase XerD
MTPSSPAFPALLQDFFSQRLMAQRQASPRTVASYRDAFRLLLGYAQARLNKPASALTLADLDAPLILGFLDHLEGERQNSARTRNARLAALRSFLHYAALRDPTALAVIQRTLAIPTKRFDRPLLGFLSREEMEAILAAPDRSTWSRHRDHVLLATLYNTGARVSEIIAVRVGDVALDHAASIRLHGKGRKDRAVPLWKSTVKRLQEWLPRVQGGPQGHSSPTAAAVRSRAPASKAASAPPSRPRPPAVLRSRNDGSHPTRCGTPRRCISCSRASTCR